MQGADALWSDWPHKNNNASSSLVYRAKYGLLRKIWFIEQMKYIEQHGPSHNCYCKVPSLCTFIVGTSVTEYFSFHHLTGCRVTHTHIESNKSYAPYYSQQPYKPVFPIEMYYTAHWHCWWSRTSYVFPNPFANWINPFHSHRLRLLW